MNLKTIFLVSLFCLNLTACLDPPQEVLKIGSNGWIGYEPLYLARSLGYFSPRKVRIIDYPATIQSVQAFRNNLIDGLMISLNEAVTLLPFVPDLRVILILDISNGGDALITQPNITKLEQLKGATIAAENTILSRFLLQKALNKVGLSFYDANLVFLNWDKHEDAFLSKTVDGIISGEPITSSLVEKGGINLFNSRYLPNQIIDVLVVRNSVLQSRKEDWKMLVNTWFKALQLITQEEKTVLPYIAARQDTTPEVALKMMSGVQFPNLEQNYHFLGGGIPILQRKTEQIVDWMITNNYIPYQIPNDSASLLASIEALSDLIPWQ
jgi:NitT/TauT family transport system substrate-binding protein